MEKLKKPDPVADPQNQAQQTPAGTEKEDKDKINCDPSAYLVTNEDPNLFIVRTEEIK